METQLQAVTERQHTVAQVAGIAVEHIAQVRLDIAKMLDNGLLIDIDLHGFSCLKTGVSWEELGINLEDDRRMRMSTGMKFLAPAHYVKRLTSLEVRFRQCLDKYGAYIAVFRPWRWLPFSAYSQWQSDWQALVAELQAFKIALINDYESCVDENRRYFEQVARAAWRAYQAPYQGQAVVVTAGRAFATYPQFEDFIITAALSKMPTVDFIQHGIYPDYKTGYMVTSPEIQHQYALAEAAQAAAAKLAAEAQGAWQQERAQAQALTEKQLTLTAQAAAVRQAELEHARAQLSQMTSPIAEMTAQFRNRIYDAVVAAAKSMQKNGNLRGKTAEMLAGLSGLYKTLASVTNDTELETALAGLDSALLRIPAEDSTGKYNLAAVATALDSLVALTQETAHTLERASVQETRAGLLELD